MGFHFLKVQKLSEERCRILSSNSISSVLLLNEFAKLNLDNFAELSKSMKLKNLNSQIAPKSAGERLLR